MGEQCITTADMVKRSIVDANKSFTSQKADTIKQAVSKAVDTMKAYKEQNGDLSQFKAPLNVLSKKLGTSQEYTKFAKDLGYFDLLVSEKKPQTTQNSTPAPVNNVPRETLVGGLTDVDPDSASTYLDKIFQGGRAKDIVISNFREKLVLKLLVDIFKGTEALDSDLNKNINALQEELFSVIKNYAKKFQTGTFITDTASKLFTEHGSNIVKILDEFAIIEPTMDLNNWKMRPSEINELYAAYTVRGPKASQEINDKAERFEALQSLIMLSHFDDLLKETFGQWIQPKKGYHNVPLPETRLKYEFVQKEAKNLKQSWGDKEKSVTVWDESNDRVRLLLSTMPLYKKVGGQWVRTDGRIDKNIIEAYVRAIKGAVRQLRGRNNGIDLNGVSWEIFGIRMSNLSKETDLFLSKVYNHFDRQKFTFGDLISYARQDTLVGFKAVSELLYRVILDRESPFKSATGLTTADVETIVSIHKNIFDNDTDAQSLIKASQTYYRQVASLFNRSAVKRYTQLVVKNGYMTTKELTAESSRWTSYEIQNSINAHLLGNLLIGINRRYRPIIDVTNPDDPTITFFLKGDVSYKVVYHPRATVASNQLTLYRATSGTSLPVDSPSREWKITNSINKKAVFDLVKSVWGRDLYNRQDIFEALKDELTSESQAINYLAQLFIPLYANAVALNSLDIGERTEINQVDYNRVKDPYSIKAGEVIYRRENDKLIPIIVVPNGKVRTGKDEQGQTRFTVTRTYYDSEGNKKEDVNRFYPREQGFRSIGKNGVNTVVPITDDTEILSISEVRNSIIDGDEFFYKGLNIYNVQKQWSSPDNKINKRESLGILDIFSSRIAPLLETLAKAENKVNRIHLRSTIRTGEGTDLAAGDINSLDAEREVFTALQGIGYNGKYVNPLVRLNKRQYRNPTGNPDEPLHRDWQSIYKGHFTSREFANGPQQKQHKDFNLKENFTSAFINEYIVPLYVDNTNRKYESQKIEDSPGFVNAVVSDKNQIPIDRILREVVLGMKTLDQVDVEINDMLGRAYSEVLINIEEDFSTLTNYVKGSGSKFLPGFNELGKEELAKLNITMVDDFAEFNKWCENNHVWFKKHGLTPLKFLRLISADYNLKHRFDTIDLIEETHYRTVFKKAEGDQLAQHLEANLPFIQTLYRFTKNFWESEFASNYDIKFEDIATAHFARKYESPEERRAALDEWSKESDYKQFQATNTKNFLWALLKNDVQLSLRNEQGEYNKWANITGWSKEEFKKNDFYDSDMFVLAVVKDINGNIISKITKRSDLYGLTDDAGRQFFQKDFNFDTTLNYNGQKVSIVINPELELFNRRHFYFNQLSVLTKNGSHIWSDAKGNTNTPKEENAKYGDFIKRNVVNTATNSQYRLGDVYGIPYLLNVAVIEDIKALCFGENGDETNIKPYDGMTRVDPFMMYWENASLDDEITASTKKPIMYAFLEKYLAGFVLKTASFAITNQSMRESYWDRRMMWKMTNPKWASRFENKYIYGDNFSLDITKSDEGNIHYGGDGKNKESYLYYWIESKDGKREYYRINNINKTNTVNTYDIYVQRVNSKGLNWIEDGHSVIHKITKKIDSNHTFWEALGGYQSLEYDTNQKRLVNSENSIKKVAEVASKIKTIAINTSKGPHYFQLTQDLIQEIKQSNGIVRDIQVDRQELRRLKDIVSSSMNLSSTSHVTTPLKQVDIHLLATKGAVKKGFANINGTERYYDNNPLNFMRVKAYDYGTQLDAEHEADGSIVSMMTQVISALADRGYTHDLASHVYNALSMLTNLAVEESLENFSEYTKTGNRNELQHTITRLLVQEFMKTGTRTSQTDIAKAVTSKLIQQGFDGKPLTAEQTRDLLPFSDDSMFNHLQSTIASIINKTAIKAKMFGSLSVLCPAHDIQMQLGDKKISDITSYRQLESLQKEMARKSFNDISQVRMKRTYEIKYSDNTTETFTVNNLMDYYELYDRIKPLSGYTIYEKIYDTEQLNINTLEPKDIEKLKFGWYLLHLKDGSQVGINIDNSYFNAISKYGIKHRDVASIDKVNLYARNLAPYDTKFETVDGEHYSLYDLDAVRKKYEIERLTDILKKVSYVDEQTGNTNISTESIQKYQNSLGTSGEGKFINSIISKYLDLKKNNDFINSLKSDLAEGKGLANIYKMLQNELDNLTDTFQEELYKISRKKKPGTFFDEDTEERTVKLYDGREVQIKDYTTHAYEALLPRLYATQYGLRPGDSLADIDSYEFFFRRALENYKTEGNQENYDIVLKRTGGNHIYIKLNSIDKNQFLAKSQFNTVTDGKRVYRVDQYTGKRIHRLNSNDDEVWVNTNTNNEIIVVKSLADNPDTAKNLKFYLDNFSYQDIELSDRLQTDATIRKIVFDAIGESINKQAKTFSNDYSEAKYTEYFQDKKNLNDSIDQYLNPFKYLNETQKSQYATEKEARKALIESTSGTNRLIKRLNYMAKAQYASFLHSLEYTVARIPAQSMQSFMAMKVVGFVEENVNNCFVCDDQIWLQGSDFDIDKATFMGYAIDDNGIMYQWSPYFSTYSYDHINASKFLPFPTFKGFTVETGTNQFDYRQLLYDEKNNKNGIIEYDENGYHLVKDLTPEQIFTLAKLLNTFNVIAAKTRTKEETLTNGQKVKKLILFADEESKDLAEAIVQIVNNHNRIGDNGQKLRMNNMEEALKNYIAANTYNISIDPANIPASQTSVDVAAAPLKDLANTSTFGGRVTDNRPGDASIFWSALETNQVGKDVIGITASNGVKVYYALTQVINEKLANGSSEDLKNLEFNVTFNGKRYRFLADAFVALSKELDPSIKKAIKENRQKADLMISGILSLATDNAKELKLGSLNAGRDIAGLYLYGITVGIPVEELYEKLTSPTAIVLDRLMKGNILTNDNQFPTLTSAINYLISGPNILGTIELRSKMRDGKYPITEKLWTKFIQESGDTNIAAFNSKTKLVEGLLDSEMQNGERKFKSLMNTIIDSMATEQKFNAYVKKFRAYKNMIKSALETYDNGQYSNQLTAQRIRRNLQQIEDYIFTIRELAIQHRDPQGNIDTKLIFKDLADISMLENGYQEVGNIRALLGLNQGIKTLFEDKLKFYEDFSNFILKRAKGLRRQKKLLRLIGESTESIDDSLAALDKFTEVNTKQSGYSLEVLDENPYKISFSKYMEEPENGVNTYKEEVQKLYDNIKQSFNIFRVVESLPHYKEYLRSAYIDFESSSIAAKFRIFNEVLVPLINSTYRPNSRTSKTYLKRASQFLGGVLANSYLREEPILELVDQINDKHITHKVQLGTSEGNEIFKLWMEGTLIPMLKERPEFVDNKFIQDLEAAFNNQTENRNTVSVFTLPINMIPRAELEKNALSRYIVDFNQLNRLFPISTTSGGSIQYNLVDLFFYYNLINYRNSVNANSLTPLFQSLLERGANEKLTNYMKFISSFDRVNDFKLATESSTTDTSFSKEDILKALAPTDKEVSIYDARRLGIPYIRFFNNVSMRYELFKLDQNLVDEFNFNRDLRRQIREDSWDNNQVQLLNKLKADKENLEKNSKPKTDSEKAELERAINALDRRISRVEGRLRHSENEEEQPELEAEEAEAVEAETTEQENQEETESDNLAEVYSEYEEETVGETDLEESETENLSKKKTWFEKQGYRSISENEIIRDIPYFSTLGKPISMNESESDFKAGNVSAKLSMQTRENKRIFTVKDIKVKVNDKQVSVPNIEVKNLDKVLGVDMDGNIVVYSNALAVEINPEIEKELVKTHNTCE